MNASLTHGVRDSLGGGQNRIQQSGQFAGSVRYFALLLDDEPSDRAHARIDRQTGMWVAGHFEAFGKQKQIETVIEFRFKHAGLTAGRVSKFK